MRFTDYLRIAFRNVRRQRLRSSLTIVALGISTCVFLLMVAISIGGRQAILDQFGSSDSLSVVLVLPNQNGNSLSPFGNVQEVGASGARLDNGMVAQLAKIPHVDTAAARVHLWELNTFNISKSSKTYSAQVDGISSNAYLPLQAGRHFSADNESGMVILGAAYAKSLNVSPEKLIGNTVTITTQRGYRGTGADIPGQYADKSQIDGFNASTTTISLKIVGVTQSGPNQNSLFVPLESARDIRTARYYEAGMIKSVDQMAKDGYTSIQVKVDSFQNVASVTKEIQKLGYGQSSLFETAQQVNQLTTTVGIILGAVSTVAMIAAVLGVVNTMVMAVAEQRHEIGVWRACGARKSVIMRLFLIEAAILGLIGGILGVMISLPVTQLISSYGSSLLQMQGLEPVAIASISLPLSIAAVCATVLLSAIAGYYPARRAAALDPSRVLGSL